MASHPARQLVRYQKMPPPAPGPPNLTPPESRPRPNLVPPPRMQVLPDLLPTMASLEPSSTLPQQLVGQLHLAPRLRLLQVPRPAGSRSQRQVL